MGRGLMDWLYSDVSSASAADIFSENFVFEAYTWMFCYVFIALYTKNWGKRIVTEYLFVCDVEYLFLMVPFSAGIHVLFNLSFSSLLLKWCGYLCNGLDMVMADFSHYSSWQFRSWSAILVLMLHLVAFAAGIGYSVKAAIKESLASFANLRR